MGERGRLTPVEGVGTVLYGEVVADVLVLLLVLLLLVNAAVRWRIERNIAVDADTTIPVRRVTWAVRDQESCKIRLREMCCVSSFSFLLFTGKNNKFKLLLCSYPNPFIYSP